MTIHGFKLSSRKNKYSLKRIFTLTLNYGATSKYEELSENKICHISNA